METNVYGKTTLGDFRSWAHIVPSHTQCTQRELGYFFLYLRSFVNEVCSIFLGAQQQHQHQLQKKKKKGRITKCISSNFDQRVILASINIHHTYIISFFHLFYVYILIWSSAFASAMNPKRKKSKKPHISKSIELSGIVCCRMLLTYAHTLEISYYLRR